MPELTLKEIQARVTKLDSTQSIIWNQIWNDIGYDKEKEPYKKMNFEQLDSIRTRIHTFRFSSEPAREYGLLSEILQRYSKIQLDPADKELFDSIMADMKFIENGFKTAEKEEKRLTDFYDEKIKDIVHPEYPRLNAIPNNVPYYITTKIFSQIMHIAQTKPNIDLKPLADLIVFIYGKAPAADKTRIFAKLQVIKNDSNYKKLTKAIREVMESRFSKSNKLYSDEDKETLRNLFKKDSWLAKIFRKSSTQVKQQATNAIIATQNKKHSR